MTSTNASLPSSDFNIYEIFQNCINTTPGTAIHIAFTVVSLLLLVPLCVFVLYLGHKQSRQHSSGLKTSHADVFTYHVAVLELLSVFGTMLICCAIYVDLPYMRTLGIYFYTINLPGQVLFHILTCLERFLAVVHPITYRSLRTAKGVRLRNISVSCSWLFIFTWTVVLMTAGPVAIYTTSFCLTVVFLIAVSSCSLSVLCVLYRPGPGEGGGVRRVDQSKMRALYTILAILGVLLFRFAGNMLSTILFAATPLDGGGMCALWLSVVWFFLPSRLVLPLLFLQRVGKLCCRKRNDSG